MPALKSIKYSDNFTVVPNSFAQDQAISFDAKGFLLDLLSRPKNWIVHKMMFVKKPKESDKFNKDGRKIIKYGYTVINRIFKELKEAGYIYLYNIRDEKKKILDRVWIISDLRIPKSDWQLIVKYLDKTDDSMNKELFEETLTIGNLTLGFSYVKESLRRLNRELQNKDYVEKTDSVNKPLEDVPLQPDNSNNGNGKTKGVTLEFLAFFDQFWSLYPQRNGKHNSGRTATMEWMLKNVPQKFWSNILTGVRNYKKYPEVLRGFAKNELTWLHSMKKENFEDWQEEIKQNGTTHKRSAQTESRAKYGDGQPYRVDYEF